MDKVLFEAYGDRVLIKPDDPETMSQGGIIIPARSQDKTCCGWIKSVGSKVDIPGINVGEHVHYEKYAGTELQVKGVTYVIVKQTDVLGGILAE